MKTTKESGVAQTTLIFAGTLVLIAAISIVILSTTNSTQPEAVTEVAESDTLPINPNVNTNGDQPIVEPIDEGGLSAAAPKEKASLPEVDDEVIADAIPATTEPGTYTDYDPKLLANAADGDVVLLFSADWCPSCRTLDKDIKANLSEIPSNITLLVVDYDTEHELRKKYGVTRQHTLVQVDANGDKIKTLTGVSNTLIQVVQQL
tara:strand:- start:3030 stop:3644 length:615 start_codon:yes stop_codon:yes gene_type:complete